MFLSAITKVVGCFYQRGWESEKMKAGLDETIVLHQAVRSRHLSLVIRTWLTHSCIHLPINRITIRNWSKNNYQDFDKKGRNQDSRLPVMKYLGWKWQHSTKMGTMSFGDLSRRTSQVPICKAHLECEAHTIDLILAHVRTCLVGSQSETLYSPLLKTEDRNRKLLNQVVYWHIQSAMKKLLVLMPTIYPWTILVPLQL